MAVPSTSSQYHLGDSIGFGAFGVAYLGTHKTDQEHEVVIKKIYDTAAKEEDVKALKELKHDRILEIRDSYVDEMGTLYLVMEKADKSSLTKLLSCNSTPTVELNVWRFLSHLSSGLAYLHQRNILHQDLNPDNVMAVRAWSEVAKDYRTDWKLADFSLPTLLNQEVKERFYSHVRGSGQVYWAPEALNEPGVYGPTADIWSLGAVVSAFCNQGKHLFTNMQEVMEWTQGSSLPNSYSQDLKNLQGKMLSIDTESRPTAKELSAECTPERQAIHLDAQPDEKKQVALTISTESFTESTSDVLSESSTEKEPAVPDIMRNDNQEIGGQTATHDLDSKKEMEQDTIDNKENIIQATSYPEENSKEEQKENNQIKEDFTPKKKERKKKKKLENQLVEKNHELESSVLITDIDENKDKKKKKKKDKKNKDSKESKEKKHRKVAESNTNIPAVQESHSHEKVQLDKTDENKIPMDMINISTIEFPNGSISKIPNGTVSNLSDISVDKVTDKKIDTQGKGIDGVMVSGISQNISLSRRSSIYDDTLSCATDTLTRRKKKRAPIPQLSTPIQGVVEPVMNMVSTNQPQVVKRKKKKAPPPPDIQKPDEIHTTPPPDIQKPAEIHTTPLPNTQKPSEKHTFPLPDIQKPAEILTIQPSDMPKPAEIRTIKEVEIPADIEKIPSPIPRKKYTVDKFEENTEIHSDLRMPPIPKERRKKKNKNKTDGFTEYKEANVMQESITSFASEGSIDSGVDVIETPPTSECSQEFPNHSDDILRSEVILNDVDNSTHDSVEDTNEEHTDDTLQQLTQDNEIETPSDVGIEEIELDDTIYESPVGTENFDNKNVTNLKFDDVESIVGDAIEVSADEKLMVSEDDEIISTDKDELTSEFIDDENKEIKSGIIYWEKTCKPLENIDDFSLDQVSIKLEDEDKLDVESQEEFEEEIIDMSKSDDKLKMDQYHQGNVEKKNDFDINSFIKEESENNQFNRYPSSDENTPRSLRNVLEESMNSGEYNTVQNNMIKKDIPKKTFVQLVTPVITLQTWGERSSKKVTVQNHQSESGAFWEELHQKEENVLELNSSTKKTVDRSESRIRNVNVPIQTYKPIKIEKSIKQEEKKITVQNHQSDNGEFWERVHRDSENELQLNSLPAKAVNQSASNTKNVNVSIRTYKPIKSEMSIKKEEKKQLKAKDKMQKPSINSINSLETHNNQATYSRVNSTEEEENITNVKNTGNVFSNILRDFDEKRFKKISEVKNIEKPIIKPKPDLTQLTKKKQISNGVEEVDNENKSNDVKVEMKRRKENGVDKISQDSNDYLQKQNTFYLDAFPSQSRKTSYSGNTLPKVPRKTSMAPVVTHNWKPVNPQLNGISASKDTKPLKGQLNGISENKDRIKPYTSLSWRYNDNEKRKVSEPSMSNSTIEKQPKGEILIEEKNNSEEVKENGFPEAKDMNNSSPRPAPRLSLSDSNKLQKENNAINNQLKVKDAPAPWDVFMESIQKGAKLKPVMTNDRSSPMLTRKLKKIQPVDIYDRDSQQVTQNKPLKNQPPSLTNQEPPKTFQDPHELSHIPVQPPQIPPPPQSLGSLHSSQSATSPSPPPPPPVHSLKSSQSHPPTSRPSPPTDNGDLLKAIQNGKKLRPVSNIEKRVPEPDARSNFLNEIREGKKLKSVQSNDRSGPLLRTGKYS